MQVKLLFTEGDGKFYETLWDKPEITDDEIEVKTIMTGICRSDIDMMNGDFGPLPLHMSGHEGLGQVTKIGANIEGVKIGDYVATRGEPAYADYYNVRKNEFIIVPEAHPRYILEPVACGINLYTQHRQLFTDKIDPRILILGSGFLAYVVYQTLKISLKSKYEIVVCGNNNKDIWGEILSSSYEGTFDIVIDLSNRTDVFDKPILNNEAVIVFGTQKQITTDFSNLLWKACTIVFPSPRTQKFPIAMTLAEFFITSEYFNIDKFWTKEYSRENWEQAFTDGNNRPENYSRGYIKW
jgi:D-arabinose 1-dehydrogenase-like Zn-dependent alcohol dehydrogenase